MAQNLNDDAVYVAQMAEWEALMRQELAIEAADRADRKAQASAEVEAEIRRFGLDRPGSYFTDTGDEDHYL